ncbi:MAG TPA: pyridoxamine 5'-phosphate oxidase family protein [Candidatus Baltobacteraceae bacterium]|nr:pyridoxamine 5'-phosphate oxidase family protein [Candidatus Baltobacteraceae bacterium]
MGTAKRAEQFYANQVLDHINEQMRAFIAQRDVMFVATADAEGNCDATLRAGRVGFVRVVDEKTLLYPEYRGNGVMASLGNMTENAHIGLLFVDFTGARVGLHVNGAVRLFHDPSAYEDGEPLVHANLKGQSPLEHWVEVTVHEAYIHCSKHIPRYGVLPAERRAEARGTEIQDGDFFRVRRTNLGRQDA